MRLNVSNMLRLCNNFDIIKFEYYAYFAISFLRMPRASRVEKRGPRIHQPFTYSILHHQFPASLARRNSIYLKAAKLEQLHPPRLPNEKDIYLSRGRIYKEKSGGNLQPGKERIEISTRARIYHRTTTKNQVWRRLVLARAFGFIQSATAAFHFLRPPSSRGPVVVNVRGRRESERRSREKVRRYFNFGISSATSATDRRFWEEQTSFFFLLLLHAHT